MNWIISTFSLFFSFHLIACANAPDLSMIMTDPIPVSTRPAPTLKIFSQGHVLPETVLNDFSSQFQAKINYSTAIDESSLADIQAGLADYDLVILSDTQVGQLRPTGLFAPLHLDHISNFKNIDPAFLNPLFDPGNRYCIPFQWGTMGLGYQRQTLGRVVQGWADFFKAETPLRVGLPHDSRLSLAAALLYLGNSPNTTNNLEITEAQQLWQKHAEQVVIYAPRAESAWLTEGQVELLFARSSAILQMTQTNPGITYVIPAEGSPRWVDNLCLLADSANRELAETFINYLLEAEVSATLANTSHTGSTNQAALALINPLDQQNPALYPDDGLSQRLFSLVNVDPATSQRYDEMWTDLVAEFSPVRSN